MNRCITQLVFGFLAAFLSAQTFAQLEKPLSRERTVECAGAFIASSALGKKEDRAGLAQIFFHFVAKAAALDTSNGPKEAAAKATTDSYKVSENWLESIFGKDGENAQSDANLALFKKEAAECLAAYEAHMSGFSTVASQFKKR